MQELTLDDGSKLTWDRNTRITIEGKPGRLEDLKQGERVRVSFEERNGKAMAVILEELKSAVRKGLALEAASPV